MSNQGSQHQRPHHGAGDAGFWVQPEEAAIQEQEYAFQPQFHEVAMLPGFSPAPGIQMNVMSGARAMVNWVRIEPGASVPTHAHHHEQLGLVVEGEIHMTIGDETKALTPGWAYTIPGNYPHSAVAGPQGCLVLDVFSPPRDDYRSAAHGPTS